MGRLLAAAEPLLTRFFSRPGDGAKLAFLLVAAIAERLRLGQPTLAPPILLACLNRDRKWTFLCDMTTRHLQPLYM